MASDIALCCQGRYKSIVEDKRNWAVLFSVSHLLLVSA